MNKRNTYIMNRDYFFAKIVYIIMLMISFSACDFEKHVKGNDKLVKEERTISQFNSLEIHGSYEIILVKDINNKIEIEGEENLIPYISTDVIDNTLQISNTEKIKTNKTIKIFIPFKQLSRIYSGGASSIRSTSIVYSDKLELNMNGAGHIDLELEVETLEIDLSGTGMIYLSGNVEMEDLNLSGAGNLDASNLVSKQCNIDLSGIGSVSIHVEDHLKANLSGVGGIKYKGNPVSVTSKVAGIGTIKKMIE